MSDDSADNNGPDLSDRIETAQDRLTDAADIAREYATRVRETLAAHRTGLRPAGALAAVAAVLAGFVATAWLGWGALAGALFVGGLVAGAAAPPVAILMFREAVPNIVGTGLAIAAQVAFGKAGLVRREDGQYEWGALREDGDERYVALANGGRIDVDATDGELFSFGFGDLAVSEAHGSNLDRFRETHTPRDSDQPTERRAGIPVETPRKEGDDTYLVSLAKIQRVVRGSASSELVRRGRDKALDEAGGTGQLSTLWTMAFAAALLVVGFGMTAGVLLL